MDEGKQDDKPSSQKMTKVASSWPEKLVMLLVFLAFAAWITSPSWLAYYWSYSKKRQLETEGWTIVSEAKGGELIYPWSLVFPYTNSLCAVDLGYIRAHKKDGVFLAPVLTLRRGTESDGPKSWLGVCVFDTKKSKVTTIFEGDLDSVKERAQNTETLPDNFLDSVDWKDATTGGWKEAFEAVKSQTTK